METKSTDNESRLLIVGGSGWVGLEFVQVVCQLHRFSEVFATSRDWGHYTTLPGVQCASLDLTSDDFKIPTSEYLIYCAGSVPQSGKKFEGYWQESALRRVLQQFFEKGGTKAYVVSSGAVYDACGMPKSGFHESQWVPGQGITAHSEYGKIKQQEEVVVEEFRGRGHTIGVGRLFTGLGTQFSKSSRYAFVDFIRQQKQEGAIRIESPTTLRSFIWMPEWALATSLWLLNGTELMGTVNVTGRNTVSMRQLALGLFPGASLIEGNSPASSYFGDPYEMLSRKWLSDVMTSESAIGKAREELQL